MFGILLLNMILLCAQATYAVTYEVPECMRTVDAKELIDRGLRAIYSKFGDMHRYRPDICNVVFKNNSILVYRFIEQFNYGQCCHVFEYDSVNDTVVLTLVHKC